MDSCVPEPEISAVFPTKWSSVMGPFENWVTAAGTCPLSPSPHPSVMQADLRLCVILEGQRPSRFQQLILSENSYCGAHAFGCPTNTTV